MSLTEKTIKSRLHTNTVHSLDLESRIIRINAVIGVHEEIASFSFDDIDTALNLLEHNSTEDIIIKINSPGGDVYEALAIIGRIKASPCRIITEGYGHVMSAATLILMSADHRRMSKFCVPMFHKISFGVAGDLDNVGDTVGQTKREQKRWAAYYEQFSKKSSNFWMTKMKRKEFYPTPEQLLEYGAVDELF